MEWIGGITSRKLMEARPEGCGVVPPGPIYYSVSYFVVIITIVG